MSAKKRALSDGSAGWIVNGALTVIAVGTTFLITYSAANDWDAMQWGPLSGWFSGLLTAGAVSIALWQVVETRKVAEGNKRSEQARTITPIWTAGMELQQEYEVFQRFLINSQNAVRIGHPRNQDLARSGVKAAQRKWQDQVRAVEFTFEPALLTITEPHTLAAIVHSYAQFSMFANQVWADYHDVLNGRPYRHRRADQLLRQFRLSRRTVFLTAHQHLIQGPPLEFRTYDDNELDETTVSDATAD